MSTSPFFIIIHGAWQSSTGWAVVADLLKAKGHAVALIDLPGHGKNTEYDFATLTLTSYVEYVCSVINAIKEDHHRVILVGHSMAGMVISQVAEQIKVDHLIYVAAFLPVDGECMMDILEHSKIAGLSNNLVVNQEKRSISLIKEGLDKIFYNDCDPVTVAKALADLQPEPLMIFQGKVNLTQTKMAVTPKTYIECTEDNSVSIDLQRFMQSRWPCLVVSLGAGHAPYYSLPERIAEILVVH